jgi:small subunit ribosomal protein S19e
MTDPWEAPAQALIPKLALQLREKVHAPQWASFVRTGMHTERAPTQEDWFYVRCASVMRKLHRMGPVGVSRLASEYGGRRDRGSAPYHAVKGSRSVLTEVFHELEKAGLVTKRNSKGRMLSPEGQKLLQKATQEVMTELAKKEPLLKKYL